MHTNALDLALAAIDDRRWKNSASKRRVLCVVRINTLDNPGARSGSFVVLPRPLVTSATGMEDRWVHRVLNELVDDAVLDRDPGAGRRAHAYRFAEPITSWRVPWSIDPRLVEHRAARLVERQVPAETGLAARHHAQLYDVAARHGAQQPGCSCAQCRAATAQRTARHGAQQRLADAVAPLSLEVLRTSLEEEARADRVVGAVEDRCRGPLFGRPAQALRHAVAGLDDAQVVELCRRIGEYVGPEVPPIVAEWAQRQAGRLRDDPGGAAASQPAAPDDPPPPAPAEWLRPEWQPEEWEPNPDAQAQVRSLADRLAVGREG